MMELGFVHAFYRFIVVNSYYFMVRVVSDFYLFFMRPYITSERMVFRKWNVLFVLLILNLILHSVHELINVIFDLVYIHKMEGLTDSFDDVYPVLILAVFIVPFLEEGMFRIYISKKNNFISAFLFVLFGLLLSYDSPVMRLIYFGYIIFLLSLIIFRIRSKDNFKWMIYGSSFFFSFLHVSNYDLIGFKLFDYFIFSFELVPNFIGGMILAYIRVLFGFKFSVLSHGLWNLLVLLLSLMFT